MQYDTSHSSSACLKPECLVPAGGRWGGSFSLVSFALATCRATVRVQLVPVHLTS